MDGSGGFQGAGDGDSCCRVLRFTQPGTIASSLGRKNLAKTVTCIITAAAPRLAQSTPQASYGLAASGAAAIAQHRTILSAEPACCPPRASRPAVFAPYLAPL